MIRLLKICSHPLFTASVDRNGLVIIRSGYAVAVDSTSYLIVRDITYLNSNLALQWGAFVTALVYVTPETVKQQNHQVYFAGSHPYDIDGSKITNIGGGGEAVISLNPASADVVVQRQFSNKLIVGGQMVDYAVTPQDVKLPM
ncbi:hypothetical protein BJ123_13116 [Rhodopseudomonas thermotolerans]|uniref:DUF6791 domain-containing protein n=2 Tax=Rhodopseudomonas TaxID=1073 RepID=A0A336JU61_9BRAD|nr:hypothetical protein BJ125_13116 [Rhodopseudomonas pentothenatexigens]REF90378.1 hypothetical protein BJ123_13116 [Rhodopseudomonas thermotolerans]SSW93160.1 hypothetical protein SAMN05892882_13116 [Rhodopseudomonas pentothenatexigens]